MIKHIKIGLHFAKGFESCWWRKFGSGDDLCPSPFLSKVVLVLNKMPRQRIPNRGALYPPLHKPGISNWANKATQFKSSFPEAGNKQTHDKGNLPLLTPFPRLFLTDGLFPSSTPLLHRNAICRAFCALPPGMDSDYREPLFPGIFSAFLETATILLTEKPWHLTVFSPALVLNNTDFKPHLSQSNN